MMDDYQIGFLQFRDQHNKQTCCECTVELENSQAKFRTHDFGCFCDKSICICCCLQKARQHQINSKPIILKCCEKAMPNFNQSFSSLIKWICTICGTNCSPLKVKLGKGDPYFHVGVSCYVKLRDKNSYQRSKLEEKILKDIQQYCYEGCNSCKDGLVNIIKAEINSKDIWKNQKQLAYFEISKQWKICQRCYEKYSKKEKIKAEIVYNRCVTCDQIQIYQKLPNWFGYGAVKQFDLVQCPKQWPLPYSDPSKVWKCSICIYKAYLQDQFQNSKLKMDKKLFNLVKIEYQKHFKLYCMGCSVKASSSKFYLIQSPYTYGICSFMCTRCYEQHSKGIFNYKHSKTLKQSLDSSRKNKPSSSTIIERKNFELRVQKLIEIFQNQAQGLLQLGPNKKNQNQNKFEVPQDEFTDSWADQYRYSSQNTSMINHIDLQSEHSRSHIDPVFYENSLKQTILESSSDQKVKNVAQRSIKHFQDEDEQIMSGKRYQPQDMIFEMELQKFEFKPQPKQSKLKQFYISGWQKSVIQQFKNITQNQYIHKTDSQQAFKPVPKQIWASRSMINEAQNSNPKQRCLMYNECKKEQQNLKIQLLCDMCFVKYVVGVKQITVAVETKKLVEANKFKPEFKPEINQEPQTKSREQSGFFRRIFN